MRGVEDAFQAVFDVRIPYVSSGNTSGLPTSRRGRPPLIALLQPTPVLHAPTHEPSKLDGPYASQETNASGPYCGLAKYRLRAAILLPSDVVLAIALRSHPVRRCRNCAVERCGDDSYCVVGPPAWSDCRTSAIDQPFTRHSLGCSGQARKALSSYRLLDCPPVTGLVAHGLAVKRRPGAPGSNAAGPG